MKKKLTIKQEKFIDVYIANDGNATKAATEAGYSKKTAPFIGSENLKKPYIIDEIDRRRAELRAARQADTFELLEFFADVVRDQEEQCQNRLRAAENLAKIQGLFETKVKITADVNSKVDVESELKKRGIPIPYIPIEDA